MKTLNTVVVEFKKGGTTYNYLYSGEAKVGDTVKVNSFIDGVTEVVVVEFIKGEHPKATQRAW